MSNQVLGIVLLVLLAMLFATFQIGKRSERKAMKGKLQAKDDEISNLSLEIGRLMLQNPPPQNFNFNG